MTTQQLMLGLGAGKVSSFTFRSNTSNTGATSTALIPATAQEGDLVILVDSIDSANTTFGAPSGFTLIDSAFQTPRKTVISYKVLGASDPGTTVTGGAGVGTNDAKLIIVFRPNATINTVTVNDLATIATAAAAGSQTINVNAVSPPIIAFASYSASAGISAGEYNFSTLTLALPSAGNELVTGYSIYNTAAVADVTISNNFDNGSNLLQSFYLSFT